MQVPHYQTPSTEMNSTMAVIKQKDIPAAKAALLRWRESALQCKEVLTRGDVELPLYSSDSPQRSDDYSLQTSGTHMSINVFLQTIDAQPELYPELHNPKTLASATRYSLHLLANKAPGQAVEVRVAPFAAVNILEGPASDPHNLTPPDVIEIEPLVWLSLACGICTWHEAADAGLLSIISERDDLHDLLPLF